MGAQSLVRRDTGKARRVGSHRGSPHSILVHVKVFGGHSLAPGVRYWGARPQVNQSRRRPGIVRRRSSWQARTLELREVASPRQTDTDSVVSHSLTLPSSFPSSLSSTHIHHSSSCILLLLIHSLNPL